MHTYKLNSLVVTEMTWEEYKKKKMEKEHHKICQALSKVSCLPGTWDKRFIQSVKFLKTDDDLTEKQTEWIFRLLFKYRRQLPEIYTIHQNNINCKSK